MKRSDKKKIQYSLIVFVIVTVGLFFLSIPIERKNKENLAKHVQQHISSIEDSSYTIINFQQVSDSLSNIGECYSIKSENNESAYACIIRIMGIEGPVTAVFFSDKESTNFLGLAGINDEAHLLVHEITDSQIAYWENTISKALSDFWLNEVD